MGLSNSHIEDLAICGVSTQQRTSFFEDSTDSSNLNKTNTPLANTLAVSCKILQSHSWKNLGRHWLHASKSLDLLLTLLFISNTGLLRNQHRLIHTYTNTYVHVWVSTFIHLYMHVSMLVFLCVYVHVYVHVYVCKHIYQHVGIYIIYKYIPKGSYYKFA